MRTRIAFIASISAVLLACGGATSTPGSGGGDGGVDSGCSLTVTGDAASGVSQFTRECQGMSIIPGGSSVSTPVVELTAANGDTSVIFFYKAAKLTDEETESFSIASLGGPIPSPMTETTPSQQTTISYMPTGSGVVKPYWSTRAWSTDAAHNRGTYTLTITSRAEELPLSDCMAAAMEGATCRVIHGTAHATLQPISGAAGTVTLDATF